MTITKEQQKEIERIAEKFHLRFVVLHGSYATGKNRPGSDLDIAILGKKPLSWDEMLGAVGEFSDIFGDSKNRELDLKQIHNIDSLFRFLIVRDGMLLYGDRTDYDGFRAFAYRDYVDSEDLRKLQDTLLRKSVASMTHSFV